MKISRFCVFQFKTEYNFLVPKRGGAYFRGSAYIRGNSGNISGADSGFPVGGAPTLIGGGTNLRHRHFSVKTYVKMKEFGPVGGGGARAGNFCM